MKGSHRTARMRRMLTPEDAKSAENPEQFPRNNFYGLSGRSSDCAHDTDAGCLVTGDDKGTGNYEKVADG